MEGSFDFAIILKSVPYLAEGMVLTFQLTFLGIAGGIFFGTLLALCRLSPFAPLSFVAGSYVNFFRSMPLILVIFWFYFLVPFIVGHPVGGFWSVTLAFIMFEAAYYCEIMRAGIQSVKRGQVQAGQASGLGYWQVQRYVVLPQAFRNMVPILVTQGIILFQDTSLVFVVSLRDFMTASSIVARTEGRLVEMYLFAALVYFAICFSGSLLVKRLKSGKTA